MRVNGYPERSSTRGAVALSPLGFADVYLYFASFVVAVVEVVVVDDRSQRIWILIDEADAFRHRRTGFERVQTSEQYVRGRVRTDVFCRGPKLLVPVHPPIALLAPDDRVDDLGLVCQVHPEYGGVVSGSHRSSSASISSGSSGRIRFASLARAASRWAI